MGEPRRAAHGRLSVLVVEDDDDLRAGLCASLASAGLAVDGVSDGDAALRWLAAAPRRPAVILLDWQMPGLDGPGFLRARREDARLARIPVVVVSAAVGHRDGPSPARGVAAVVRKPVTAATLLTAVRRAVGRPRPPAPAPAPDVRR